MRKPGNIRPAIVAGLFLAILIHGSVGQAIENR
jgi:hypothetical protein